MAEPETRLTPLGKIISVVLILALVGVGLAIVLNLGKGSAPKPETPGAAPAPAGDAKGESAEAPDASDVTTVKEYKYVPAERLPAVKGVSQYKWTTRRRSSASRTTSGRAGSR